MPSDHSLNWWALLGAVKLGRRSGKDRDIELCKKRM